MNVFALALRSVTYRPGRLAATLLATFLGSAVTMTFQSLHDTAAGPGVDAAGHEALTLTGSVVGGYGTLLVFFAVASTLTVNVRQRADEIRLLRQTGATPGQVGRMVAGEAAVVALVGTVLAVGPALLGGRAVLALLQDTGQVADGVDHVFGPIALSAGFGVTLPASAGAALLAVRRAADPERTGRARRGTARTAGGVAALAIGVAAVCSTFAMDPAEPALMAGPGYGTIMLSLGLAALSPALLRGVLGRLAGPLGVLAGASGHLAARTLRQRAGELSGVLMPLVFFVGVATGTLYMQAVESDVIAASGVRKSVEDKNLETLNLVVVGVLVTFACLMLINTLYAATAYRGREFATQRLAGATPAQVQGAVAVESAVLTVTGVFLGTVAGLGGIVPFTLVRADTPLPDRGPGVWLAVTALATAATFITSLVTTRRTLRIPAVTAVSG